MNTTPPIPIVPCQRMIDYRREHLGALQTVLDDAEFELRMSEPGDAIRAFGEAWLEQGRKLVEAAREELRRARC